MATRETVQKDIEAKVAEGEANLAKLKAKMEEAGDDAGAEFSKAVKESEHLLDKARS